MPHIRLTEPDEATGSPCLRVRRRDRPRGEDLQHRQGDEPPPRGAPRLDGDVQGDHVRALEPEPRRAGAARHGHLAAQRLPLLNALARRRPPCRGRRRGARATRGPRLRQGRPRAAGAGSVRLRRQADEGAVVGRARRRRRAPRPWLGRHGDPRRDPGDLVLQLHQPRRRGRRSRRRARVGSRGST